MDLSNPPLTQATVSTAAKRLLQEYLAGFFDGGAHAIGGVSLIFPDLTAPLGIVFDQDLADQPDTGQEMVRQLRLIVVPRRGRQLTSDEAPANGQARRRWAFDEVTLHCWLSARAPSWPAGNQAVNELGDLLFGVLRTPALTQALAQKGVRHLRPLGPAPIQNERAPLRLLLCPTQFFYPVDSD